MQRVAIVGHTGRGNYGHFLDMAFVGVEGARIVAVADPDAAGRGAVQARTGAPVGYADYREMLERERPDITVFASREIGDHCELVTTAGEFATHVYLEKPIAATPAEVDRMARALIDRIEGRAPAYELLEGRTARRHVEWALAAHASHMAGARVTLPLDTAHNPFDSWDE